MILSKKLMNIFVIIVYLYNLWKKVVIKIVVKKAFSRSVFSYACCWLCLITSWSKLNSLNFLFYLYVCQPLGFDLVMSFLNQLIWTKHLHADILVKNKTCVAYVCRVIFKKLTCNMQMIYQGARVDASFRKFSSLFSYSKNFSCFSNVFLNN